MKFCLLSRSAPVPILLVALVGGPCVVGCSFFERADAGLDDGGSAGSNGANDSGSGVSSTGSTQPTASGGGGTTSTGGTDAGYGGSCPVEPCPTSGDNLLVNGDFSDGDTGWNGQNGVLDVSTGAGCIDGPEAPAEPAGIGWGDATTNVTLSPGTTYVFSFDVTIEGTPTLIARVGGVEDPYPTYFEQDLGMVSAGTHSFEFTVQETVSAGVVFFINGGRLCVDNVSIADK